MNLSALGGRSPDLDSELLDIWGRDENLRFDQQDEDILLAEESNIELLLDGVECEDLLISKRSVLLAALCVLIYDHTPIEDEDDPDVNPHTASRVISELRSRIHLFHELDTVYISDYIREIVYPRLGIPMANM